MNILLQKQARNLVNILYLDTYYCLTPEVTAYDHTLMFNDLYSFVSLSSFLYKNVKSHFVYYVIKNLCANYFYMLNIPVFICF